MLEAKVDQSKDPKQATRERELFEAIKALLPEWKDIEPKGFKAQRMTGITNETYKISHPSVEQPFIYREFGDASDNLFINRDSEQFLYQYVSDMKMGPKILGAGDGVRLQSFIESEGLQTTKMLSPQYVEDVAFTLRKFHALHPTQIVPKQSMFELAFFSNGSPVLEKCHKKMAKDIFTPQEKELVSELKKWVTKQQIEFLKKATKPLESKRLVFSHNDLLAGNILIRKKDRKVVFIDYEYACFNYPIYDIANYFNQAEFNYEVKEPPYYRLLELTPHDQQMKQRFIDCYVRAGDRKYKEYKQAIGEEKELSEEEASLRKELMQSLNTGLMLSQLMWGWWAIIVSKNPHIQFDYITFAMDRYRKYNHYKQLCQAELKML